MLIVKYFNLNSGLYYGKTSNFYTIYKIYMNLE
jgi:hypothetical protein